jgi:hypothetical protein
MNTAEAIAMNTEAMNTAANGSSGSDSDEHSGGGWSGRKPVARTEHTSRTCSTSENLVALDSGTRHSLVGSGHMADLSKWSVRVAVDDATLSTESSSSTILRFRFLVAEKAPSFLVEVYAPPGTEPSVRWNLRKTFPDFLTLKLQLEAIWPGTVLKCEGEK